MNFPILLLALLFSVLLLQCVHYDNKVQEINDRCTYSYYFNNEHQHEHHYCNNCFVSKHEVLDHF